MLNINYRILWGVGLFSMVTNLLMLTGPLFMLQVYDRVLTSQSVPTLMVLGVLVALLFSFYGVLDFIRLRIMAHMGHLLDHQLSNKAFDLYTSSPLRGRGKAAFNPLSDLKQVRRFLSGPGAVTLFDLPWLPFYLGVVFLLHPLLGWFALAGAVALIIMAVLNELLSKNRMREANQADFEEQSIAQASVRNAECLASMGMGETMQAHWLVQRIKAIEMAGKASKVSSLFGALSKTMRLAIQSFLLGFGAYLAIAQEITPGAMIAASIIFARALAPAEQTIAQWRSIAEVRFSWQRLQEVFAHASGERDYAGTLPEPKETLAVQELAVAAPGEQKPLVKGVGFMLAAGDGLGILGPSGSGKSTLGKALVGAWSPLAGTIRLDKATLDQWPPEILGRHVGYLPQDIELFDGTIAQNICRFHEDTGFDEVIAAGMLSECHGMILQFADGYDTRIGRGGIQLSAGQRQRIALARAVFGNPFLVVLDEPNSNLDVDGDEALANSIAKLREKGAIVIVIAHRTKILAQTNKLLMLEGGLPQVFGPKEKVFAYMQEQLKKRTKKGLKIVG
ncbi:MAG: type I secretion system permease/ATPase [bacterium]|nr:type I secretion system permease/ATPase [bacterium]